MDSTTTHTQLCELSEQWLTGNSAEVTRWDQMQTLGAEMGGWSVSCSKLGQGRTCA